MTVPGERDETRLAIIEALKHFAEALELETRGLNDTVLRYRPADGEWSIKEVVAHCWYAEELWYRRLYQVWSLTDPVLMRWGEEAPALEAAYNSDIRPLLDQIKERRPRIIDLLSEAIDWTRTGQWQGEGRRSLKQLAQYLVAHDADHLGQIQTLKTAQLQPAAP